MQSFGGNTAKFDARYRIFIIVWFGLLVSVGFFFVLTLIIHAPQQVLENKVLSWTFSAIGIFLAVISFVPKQKMLNQAVKNQDSSRLLQGYIIAWALSESVGTIALILYMVAPGRAYIFMFILSAAFMLVHFPRRKDLIDASYRSQ